MRVTARWPTWRLVSRPAVSTAPAMNRALAAPLALFPLVMACVNDPVATAPSNNEEIHVDELFTHDGCTVYRFRDGNYHCYVRCTGEPVVKTLSCIGKAVSGNESLPRRAPRRRRTNERHCPHRWPANPRSFHVLAPLLRLALRLQPVREGRSTGRAGRSEVGGASRERAP